MIPFRGPIGWVGWLAVGATLVFSPSCGPGQRTVAESIGPFLDAVQREDLDQLYCRLAGAAGNDGEAGGQTADRAEFDSWARSRYDAYYEGRDSGRVDLDGSGISLVKLFALGKGTYYSYRAIRSVASNTLSVETELRFGYAHVDLSRFSPGTTFYVSGVPAGRVRPVRVPAGGREVSVEALDTILVRWTLVQSPPVTGCPGGWKVADVVPVAGTETSTEVTWIF